MAKMTIEQEKEKVISFREATSQKEKNDIFESFCGIVYRELRNYHRNSFFEELKQECCLTLFECLNKFNIEKKNKFTTYAIFAIRNKIKRFNMKNLHTITIPVYESKLIKNYYKILDIVFNYDCTHKDLKLLASELDIDYKVLESMYFAKTVAVENSLIDYYEESKKSSLKVFNQILLNELCNIGLSKLEKEAINAYLQESCMTRDNPLRCYFETAMTKLKRNNQYA